MRLAWQAGPVYPGSNSREDEAPRFPFPLPTRGPHVRRLVGHKTCSDPSARGQPSLKPSPDRRAQPAPAAAALAPVPSIRRLPYDWMAAAAAAASPPVPLGSDASALLDGDSRPKFVLRLPLLSRSPLLFDCLSFSLVKFDMPMHDSSPLSTRCAH